MSKSEAEILEVLNGLGSKKLDLDILFSYYSLKLSFEIRKVIAEKIGMQERKGYFLLEKMIKKFGLKVEFIEALKLTNEKDAKDLLLKNLYQNNKLNIHIINALEPWGGEIELTLIREIFDICEIDFWIAGLNILHFKAHQLNDEILLSTDKGSIMRCAVKEIRIAGRNTQGVRIKKLSGTEKVVSVIKIEDNIQ